jgi:hypothetical protein
MKIENRFYFRVRGKKFTLALALRRPDLHLLMSVTPGIAAALSAPLFEAVGFLEFERHWRDGRGLAFSLNLFKCNVSSVGFLFVIWLERMGSMGNVPSPNPFSVLHLCMSRQSFMEVWKGKEVHFCVRHKGRRIRRETTLCQ